MKAAILPGMPVAPSDLHICKIGDYADRREHENDSPLPAAPVRAVWIVLNSCRACNPRTERYCRAHRA